jgi:bifunctional enzyme CysN/CysC
MGSGLLRFATAGSVDDGKSTLIGRLLYDSKQIFEDQLEAVELSSRRRGDDYVDLALLTDGLRAEREQGITIDVAYRYFATPERKFIIADTPGHVQYTRNMVTGASTADLALVLVDARKGVLEQSRRHAFISSLLRVPKLTVCVNKMDLVDFSPEPFEAVRAEFGAFARRIGAQPPTFIPLSALHGDNVVERSTRMAWYGGPSLLEHLHQVEGAAHGREEAGRFPVQWVVRPMSARHTDYRGYAGQVAGGVLRKGQQVVVLPSGRTSRIAAIDTFEGEVEEAFAPMSVCVRLTDELDVGRGDLICAAEQPAQVGQDLEATVCWMVEQPLRPQARLSLKHTTRCSKVAVRELASRLDVNTLAWEPGPGALELNDIGRVTLRAAAPLAYDEYRHNRVTGSFILIDEATHATVAAGMIGPLPSLD